MGKKKQATETTGWRGLPTPRSFSSLLALEGVDPFAIVEKDEGVTLPDAVIEAEDWREEVLALQLEARAKGVAVVLIIAGIEHAGRAQTVQALMEWLDARHVRIHAMSPPQQSDRFRPPFFQFWRRLPARGTTTILFGSWYRECLQARASGQMSDAAWEEAQTNIRAFEAMLHAEGMMVCKVWLHVSGQRQRETLEARMRDASQAWVLEPSDWAAVGQYPAYRDAAASMLRGTCTQVAPWMVVEGSDSSRRDLQALAVLTQGFAAGLARPPSAPLEGDRPIPAADNPLVGLLLPERPKRAVYESKLEQLQYEFRMLVAIMEQQNRALALVFEGPDAAGKGGAIRRLIAPLDPRVYEVHAVSAPTDEERAMPWLWRFWRRLPARPRVTVFDRSWYGRVLVERIEGFCSRDDWERGFDEIREFESQLAAAGTVVVKFYLQIHPDTQLKRFQEREQTGYKRHKITDEDWRNRDRWDAYVGAAAEAFARTDTPDAPWILVAADEKRASRLAVLDAVCAHLAVSMGVDRRRLPHSPDE